MPKRKDLEKVSITLITFFMMINAAVVWAEIPLPPERQEIASATQLPGSVEGKGIHFEIKGSEYLNIILDSTEPVKINLSSVPEMVTLNIESFSGVASTQITLSGFLPQTTYYRYDDDYHNKIIFTTDNVGKYTYSQDLSIPHVIFIQPRASTIFLNENGWSNPVVGTWDSTTRTATLTTDVTETIQIDTSNVILDGKGHVLSGTNTGTGIYIPSGKSYVTVKNLKIQQFTTGIYLLNSNRNVLLDNIISFNDLGLRLTGSTNNTLKNNTIANNKKGLYLYVSNNNILTSNAISGSIFNFYIGGYQDRHFENDIDITNTVNGKPIYYIRNASNQVYDASTNAGVIYCISCSGVTIKDLILNNNGYGIFFWKTNNSKIENVTAENNSISGVELNYSGHNTLINTVSSRNARGIYLYYSQNNVLTDNTISANDYNSGLSLVNSDSNVISGSVITGNYHGLSILDSSSNKLLGNIVSESADYNFFLNGTSDVHFENDIDSSNTVDGKPIYYIRNVSNQVYDASTNAGVIYCISCNGMTIKDLALRNNYYGIFFWKTNNSKIENVTVVNKEYFSIWDNQGEGICLKHSGSNTILNNAVSNSNTGISLFDTSNNILTHNTLLNNFYAIDSSYAKVNVLNDNIISGNFYGVNLSFSNYNAVVHNTLSNNAYGANLYSSSTNNTFTDNEFSSNTRGILILSSDSNKIYHNNFLQNSEQIRMISGSNNIFNLDKPEGGNYWSGWVAPDSDKDGFVDQPYKFQGGADNLPWVAPNGWSKYYSFENGAVFTNFDLSELSSNQSTITNIFRSQKATVNNLTITGDLAGSASFPELETVSVESGSFVGQGFSYGVVEGVFAGIPCKGSWKGMSYFIPSEKKIYLKGEISGELSGIINGYLTESAPDSGIYDKYQATWKINRIGQDIIAAIVSVEGALPYQSSQSFTSSVSLYQTSMKGKAYGYYTGPLDMVITQLILDGENEYKGKGFSVISYDSAAGQGRAYGCTMRSSAQKVESSGLLESPLLGKFSATLDESKSPKTFSGIIERVDFGSSPEPDLKVKVWSSQRASPGQKVDYIIQYRNDGLKASQETLLFLSLDYPVKYISASPSVFYNDILNTVDWDLGSVPAKSSGYLSVQTEIAWGLPLGTNLEANSIINELLPHSQKRGIFVNGIGLYVGKQRDEDYTKTCQQFASSRDIEWIPAYDTGTREGDVGEVINAFKGVATSHNGLMDNRVTGGFEYETAWGYSGGTMTLVTAILQRVLGLPGLKTKELVLISPVGIMPLMLESVHSLGVEKIIIYQSEKDKLPFGMLSQLKISKNDSLRNQPWIEVRDRDAYVHTLWLQKLDNENNKNKESMSSSMLQAITTAHDPNELLVSPEGNVKPADRLNYTINYENEGKGNAYGVYITDTLEKDLDDSTLVIADGGEYNPEIRTIKWFIGELTSKQKGSISFSANVSEKAADKSEVINFATVHFPSVPETTLTNGTVNMINTLIDKVAPVTTLSAAPLPNQTGWYNSDIIITFTANDNEGGTGVKEIHYKLTGAISDEKIFTGANTQITVSSEGVSTLTYYSVDNAGNIEAVKSLVIKIDKTPPSVTAQNSPQPNSNGWNNSDVTVSFIATDSLSGIVSFTPPQTITTEGRDQFINGQATDSAGNTFSTYVTLNIDKTQPEIIVTSPVNAAEYILNKVTFTGWSASDSLSGLSSSAGTVPNGEAIDTTKVGAKSFIVTAEDNATNKMECALTYYVRYDYSGLLSPINQNGSSIFKLGRVVPVKFQLKDAFGNYISTAVARIFLNKISDNVIGNGIEAESAGEANTDNLFRYSFIDNQYIFNLGTSNLSEGTWQIKIQLDDGSPKYVNISLK